MVTECGLVKVGDDVGMMKLFAVLPDPDEVHERRRQRGFRGQVPDDPRRPGQRGRAVGQQVHHRRGRDRAL